MAALLEGCGVGSLPTTHATELNERDYGDLTGKNKWEVKAEIGEEAFNGIRRGWDYPDCRAAGNFERCLCAGCSIF
ncbi:hypothetical protein KOY49_03960 [Candidatus Minimicrobia vallesae]|uniref:Uncharacterized protein n=1 Tax=Candidatus Minimicrobia vallesae TaxID=2841264 RepID=A0A8F1SBE7_9BACT|nr:hypothetical protein [Candidatus Minimicrobia vallesae]QWQ31856.1 hypothetical protein KOY49_03960 [Candidatus Minimicrobia vallesae]